MLNKEDEEKLRLKEESHTKNERPIRGGGSLSDKEDQENMGLKEESRIKNDRPVTEANSMLAKEEEEKTRLEEESRIKNERAGKEDGSMKDKFTETLDGLKKNEKIEDLYNYAKSNTSDTIAYVAMIMGILIFIFNDFVGGIIIGIVTGIYFSKEILKPVRNLENFIEELGMVRSLILGGLILAFFIKTWMIFLSAAAVVAVKQLISPDKKSDGFNENNRR